MIMHPQIANAPGLTWRRRKTGWEARWRARYDLIERGFIPKSQRLGFFIDGEPVSDAELNYIHDMSHQNQNEMLVWGRGGIPEAASFDGTITSLAYCYRKDSDSTYQRCRINSRRYYDSLCRAITSDLFDDNGTTRTVGDLHIRELKARLILRLHSKWREERGVTMAHGMVGMIRALCTFAATILEDEDCEHVGNMLGKMRFETAKPRETFLSADQITAVRAELHRMGWHSIAMAQGFQFECTFRQMDVIGEWVPVSEPGVSEVTSGYEKWLRGIRWEEIDSNLVLTHITSKRQKKVTVDLRNAPMVIEELLRIYGTLDRSVMPASGPIIIQETTNRPWTVTQFRRHWRKAATNVGIPSTVRNMDSRAGAITEAFQAGADPEKVRKSATHGQLSMTAKYSRGDAEATANVMQLRAANRKNNSAT